MGDERMFFRDDEELGIKRNDQDKENKERHIARYKFASTFIDPGKVVLDCACGAGYGSEILSGKAGKVFGVDLDENTIKFANKYYKNDKITFINKDLFDLDFPENTFDVVVSIETIEHVKDATPYLKKVYKFLKKGGTAVLSTPMLRYKDGKPFITNPFHLNEMPREDFLKLTKNIFDECEYYAQHQTEFPPLTTENTGFCIAICKKNK
jgi:2-polyprenyl-3-methyl-5-hydroxy-6-metoxy-1,4-benzoquinol methylase